MRARKYCVSEIFARLWRFFFELFGKIYAIVMHDGGIYDGFLRQFQKAKAVFLMYAIIVAIYQIQIISSFLL